MRCKKLKKKTNKKQNKTKQKKNCIKRGPDKLIQTGISRQFNKSLHILSAYRGCEIIVNILLDQALLVVIFPSVKTFDMGRFQYISYMIYISSFLILCTKHDGEHFSTKKFSKLFVPQGQIQGQSKYFKVITLLTTPTWKMGANLDC